MKPVLVVDDEAVMRESLRDWLTDSGYQVETAGEGEEALENIAAQDFSIVIIDLKLPGKNGIEVLREARDTKPQLKGIIITAYPSVQTAAEAVKEGAVDYLPKPLDLNDLEKSIREARGPVQVEIRPTIREEELIGGETMRQVTLEKAVVTPEVRGEEKPKGKEVIMEVLARAADDSQFLAQLADSPTKALSGYYTLTQEEVAALVSGDIKRIESWVGKLDKRHATWLWCRLCQEKW